MNYAKALEGLLDRYEEAISTLRLDVQKKLINPFCDKYKIAFYSGMGGYGFTRKACKDLTEYYEGKYHIHYKYANTKAYQELSEILKVLDLKGHPQDNCSIGCHMDDYTPPIYR
jgi:hypothetical protein